MSDLEDRYSFVLRWEELPEELRDEKISAWIDRAVRADPSSYCERFRDDPALADFFDDAGPFEDWDADLEAKADGLANELVDHYLFRDEVVEDLSSHFPVYF